MNNKQRFESTEELLLNLDTNQKIKEYMESYELGGFDMDDRYGQDEYELYDMDNQGYDDWLNLLLFFILIKSTTTKKKAD